MQVTYPDLAEVLQARIRANLEAGKIAHTPPGGDERLRIDILQPHIAALEEAAEAEVLGEQRRQEGEQAAKKIADWSARSLRGEELPISGIVYF